MNDVFQSFCDTILTVIRNFAKDENSISRITSVSIDPPKDPKLGDLCTNAAMVFAKLIRISPQVLAGYICDALKKLDYVTEAEVAGPGFVNFRLSPKAWHSVVVDIITKNDRYGYSEIVKGESINVEFVSANPTGPLHTGHARNAVFGSVVVKLLERIGYKVTKEFYINDQGNQIKSLARSLYLRYRECLGADIKSSDFSEDMYVGSYVKDLAQELVSIYQDEFLNKNEEEWLEEFGNFAVSRILENIQADLKLIGVEMDVYSSEKEICSRNVVEEALSILSENGDIYDGIIPKPKGIEVEDWEERPQTLFRSTRYGDDIDRAIRKSDGTWTYFAGDIAYHLDKIRRGYNKMVDILGADHNGYAKRIQSVVKALSDGEASVDVRLYQLVNFLENGVPIRMSKRSGNFITLRDVVERVGKDIARFVMISRHHDVMIDFDFVKVVECSMDNPIFYIQYAYARICSVFRNVEKVYPGITKDDIVNCDKSYLNDEAELKMIQVLSLWPKQVAGAALALEPHRIPHYLYNIASVFHALWNKGKINTFLRFIDCKNKALTTARLSLLEAARIVLKDGLELIGITPLEEMK